MDHAVDGRARIIADEERAGCSGFRFPPFIVLERGITGAAWAEHPRRYGEQLTMLEQLADMLATLHAAGKAHRFVVIYVVCPSVLLVFLVFPNACGLPCTRTAHLFGARFLQGHQAFQCDLHAQQHRCGPSAQFDQTSASVRALNAACCCDAIDTCGGRAAWRLLDFGIVANIGERTFPRCTPLYAAPEVMRALSDEEPVEVAAAHDVWALGVVTYEVIIARPAFPRRFQASLLHRCATGAAEYPWEAPPEQQEPLWRRSRLRELVAQCLCRDPAGRPSARDIVDSIVRMSSATTVAGAPKS